MTGSSLYDSLQALLCQIKAESTTVAAVRVILAPADQMDGLVCSREKTAAVQTPLTDMAVVEKGAGVDWGFAAGVRAVASIPLKADSKRIGALYIGLRSDETDATLLQRWGQQAAALGQLFAGLPPQQRFKRDKQLNLIHRLGRRAVENMPLPDFFDLAVVSIRESLDYYNVSIFILENERRFLVLTAHAGAYRNRVAKGVRQGVDEGIMGWVLDQRAHLLVNDVTQDPRYVAVEGLETRSEVCLPILVEGEAEGVLNVESNQVDAFDEGDVVALEALSRQIAEVIRGQRQRTAFVRLKAEVEDYRGGRRLIGRSAAMDRVVALIDAVAPSDLNVLICGETGTGKELVARSIHAKSPRQGGPFIAVNCAALPDTLVESELFGHERGAFTGADRRHSGKMELAHGGTLFLDEIAEIPYAMQAKLLRAVEEQRFTRVGGEQEISVDVRIVAATNQPLDAWIDQGRFRQDLYFRLNGVQIALPPLRQRLEDIPLLAAYFLQQACERHGKRVDTIAPAAMDVLTAYPWPGNIRELENIMARAVLMEQSRTLGQVDLPPAVAQQPGRGGLPAGHEDLPMKEVCRMALEEVEREYLKRLLTRTRGNISRAAQQAGINRRTLYNKLEAYRIRRMDFIPSA